MSEATIAFVDDLVAKFPALVPMLEEHVAANFGEVLPHVFFGDLMPYVVSEFQRIAQDGSIVEESQLKGLLATLDEAITFGDDEVVNLILVSFVENLPYPDEEGAGVRDLLGPKLRSELDQGRGEPS